MVLREIIKRFKTDTIYSESELNHILYDIYGYDVAKGLNGRERLRNYSVDSVIRYSGK